MKVKNCLTVLLLTLIAICLTMTVYAAEVADRKGRVTAGINLRAAPGLSGKVITGLEPGTVVVVTREQAGWYQIAYEDETYGYRGWVYGKYVEILSVPVATVVKPTVQPDAPLAMPLSSQPSIIAPPSQSKAAAVDNNNLPAELPANTIELIQAAAPSASGAENQTTAGPTVSKVPASSANAEPTPAATHTVRTQTERKPIPAGAKAAYPGPEPGYLLSIVLRISSVLLSCLALLISYRTFQIVTATGRMT